jgi:hypothetical protein
MIARGRGWLAVRLAAATLVAAAGCTPGPVVATASSLPPRPTAAASAVPQGPGSAAAAMKALCVAPTISRGRMPPGATPPEIARVEHDVERVRDLTYERPLDVTAITRSEMNRRLTGAFDASYPRRLWDRRSRAWQAIGVIPGGSSIRDAILRYQTGQVVGFYDPDTGELVYVGTTHLDVVSEFILAHELTHAIDDQHFDLTRLDRLVTSCRDENEEAALGAVEGSAQYFATQVLLRFPGVLAPSRPPGGQPVVPTVDVPPFIQELELWPYTAGQAFITALQAKGGIPAVNRAIRHLPVSTEQVIHPERYPNDLPIAVDVPDLGSKLGSGWRDLDVEQIGEEWLKAMLALRLDANAAARAAAGWGGSLYRAWSDGSHTAVVLRTVWDTPADATEFAAAVGVWIAKEPGAQGFVESPDASAVEVAFAGDADTLTTLRAALA